MSATLSALRPQCSNRVWLLEDGSSFQNMQPCQSQVRKVNNCALHVTVAPCEARHLGGRVDVDAGPITVLVAALSLAGQFMAVGSAERHPVRDDFLPWQSPARRAL